MRARGNSPRLEMRLLLDIALRDIARVADLSATDLDLLIRLLRRLRLHGRFAVKLKEAALFDELPSVARDQLESAAVMAQSRSRVVMWELNRIEWATRDHPDIQFTCMKGCAYILLDLPNQAGRILADVDLLLRDGQLEKFEQLLNRRGWVTKQLTPYDDNYYRNWTHELPPLTHLEREVEVDLHHNIVPRTARLNPIGEKFFENSVAVKGTRFRVMADEDLVLHAMVHLMFDSDLAEKLRDLVDIDVLCRHYSGKDPEFWNRLLSRADEQGLGRPLYYSLRYGKELLGTPVPDAILESTNRWAPPALIRQAMDRLVPRALLPRHPDFPSRGKAFAGLLLYMRSHWLRMPPWLLIYHLVYKFVVIRFGSRDS